MVAKITQFLLISIFFVCGSVQAVDVQDTEEYFQIVEKTVEEVEVTSADLFHYEMSQAELPIIITPTPGKPPIIVRPPKPKVPKSELDIIVNLGSRVWKFIEKNQPVVNVSTQFASAVPRGVEHWTQLDSWSDPLIKYHITYKNPYGMNVVDINYLVTASYGGTLNGKGQYLSQAGFMMTDLNVLWGYKVDANVEVLRTANVGTAADPMGSIQMALKWSIHTVMKHNESSELFYLRGDGHFQKQ